MSAVIELDRYRFYRFATDDMGRTTYSIFPPILEAFMSVEYGVNFGYPLCCVFQYAVDQIDGKHPALRRGSVPDGNGGVYVPCYACCEEMGRECV